MAEATRGVKFVLRTETASDYAKAFGPIHAEIDRLQKRMNGVFTGGAPHGGGGGRMGGMSNGFAEAAKAAQNGTAAIGKHLTNGALAHQKALEKQQAADEKAAQRAKQIAEKQAAAEQKAREKAAQAAEKQKQREAAAAEKAAEREARAAEKRAAVEEKARQREAAAAEKAAEAKRRNPMDMSALAGSSTISADDLRDKSRGASAWQRGMDNIAKLNASAEKEAAKRANEHTEAINRQREARHRLNESIATTLGGVTRLGEGMAYLGLIGEDDSKKLTDALLAIRGISDSIQGTIQTGRDLGSAFSALRDYRRASSAVRGVGGAARGAGMIGTATEALGGAASVGSAGATAASAGGAGGAGAAATAGAPVASFAAAGIGVLAAVTSTILTAREAFKHGIGGGATEGSAVQRVAQIEVGLAEKLANAGHAVGMSDSAMKFIANTSPVGALFAPSVDSAAAARKTDEMQQRYAAEKKQRDEMNERQRAALAERFGRENQAYGRRQAGRHFREHMTSSGDHAQDLRASHSNRAMEAAELRVMLQGAVAERERIVGPQGENSASAQAVEANHRIEEINERILQTDRQRQLIAKELLQYQKQAAAEWAKLHGDKARDVARGAGSMNTYQLQRLEHIARKQKSGQTLARHEREFVERFGTDRMKQKADEEVRQIGEQRLKQFALTVYNDDFLHEKELGQHFRRKENEREQQLVRQQNSFTEAETKETGAKGGGKSQVDVDFKIEPMQHKLLLEFGGAADELQKQIAAELGPQMANVLKISSEDIVAEIVKKIRPEIQEAIRRQNNQGRHLAG